MERRREQRKEGRKERMRDSTWVGGEGKGAGNMVISGPTNRELMSGMLPATPPRFPDSVLHLFLRCLKNARSRFKSFFFREKLRSFDDFEQMSGLWSMF